MCVNVCECVCVCVLQEGERERERDVWIFLQSQFTLAEGVPFHFFLQRRQPVGSVEVFFFW